MLWRFLSREQRAGFYAKHYPTWGAITLVNVDALWENAGGRMPPPEYLRAVSTGPLAPVVVAVTIAAGALHAGISYQRAAFTAADIDKIADGMLSAAGRISTRDLPPSSSPHRAGGGRRHRRARRRRLRDAAGGGPRRRCRDPSPAAQAVLRSLAIDRALEDRILALDPEQITADDVRDTLAKGPAPRIILLHGGIYPVHLMMESAGRFLTGMGYPESRIRHPGDGRWSHSPYENSAQIAGLIAWHYERDGMRPMMIGHSQGGIQAVKVLYELAGRFDDPIRVWNPLTDAAEDRTSIVDPLTGAERPVVGLTVSYVSVVGAGGAALLLPNQWSMVGKMRTIPDAVDEFTGFAIGLDFIAWTYPGDEEAINFRRDGNTLVRGVMLPAWYNHVFVPDTRRARRGPRDARLDRCLPGRRRRRRDAAGGGRRRGAVGSRRLVQRQEALDDRGAAPRPRQARRGGQVKIAVLPGDGARAGSHEPAGPPQGRIPECAARRCPVSPPGRSKGEYRSAQPKVLQ